MITSRRSFITGLTSLLVAPAIVRVESIMPVKVVKPNYVTGREILMRFNAGLDLMNQQLQYNILYTGRAFVLTEPSGIARLIHPNEIYINDK